MRLEPEPGRAGRLGAPRPPVRHAPDAKTEVAPLLATGAGLHHPAMRLYSHANIAPPIKPSKKAQTSPMTLPIALML